MIEAIVVAILVLATAATGAVFKPGSWYETLRKPGWTPPNWMFPVVWTVLYVMIGVAGWIVWTDAPWSAAAMVWLMQLALNAAWSWLFFGLRRIEAALLDVSLLVLAVVSFIIVAQPISTIAAVLFVPYLAWVVTAGALNLRIVQLNPFEARRTS